jgi:hypothetical protein
LYMQRNKLRPHWMIWLLQGHFRWRIEWTLNHFSIRLVNPSFWQRHQIRRFIDDMKYIWAAHLLVYYSDSNSIYWYIVYITFPGVTPLLCASPGKLSSISTLHIFNTHLLHASPVLPQCHILIYLLSFIRQLWIQSWHMKMLR